jgi:hypothetical protein
MAKDVHSQADDVATTRTLSLRGSQASDSSVLGLPSAINPSLLDGSFDLDQFIANGGFTNDAVDLPPVDWTGTNDSNLHADGFDAKQFQYTDLLQNDQSGLGLGLSYALPNYSDLQYTAEPNYDFGVGLESSTAVTGELRDAQNIGYNDWASLFDGVTPGLSALPGGNYFVPDMSQYAVTDQQQRAYPDPMGSLYPTQPYFTHMQPGYPRYYNPYMPMPVENYDTAKPVATQPVRKRKPSQYSQDSEDTHATKRQREDRRVKLVASPDASRTNSFASEDSSLSQPIKGGVLKPGEKPKKCEDKPWVRTNSTTKGETTRTARINQLAEEGLKYKTKRLPYGDWQSTHYRFEYSQNNGMHEFKKRTMSARQIHEYITQYPGENLRIWVQPVASDSARRYASASHSHCRFEKCPMRKYTGKGTAEVGNYRVAFDEKHKTYGPGVVDPYDCVGYAHLYCMERFLDFAYICEVADVKVDLRVSMEKEPKGHFASAFGPKHHHEAALAKRFVDAARKGRLADTHEFSDYPIHEEYKRGAPKPHERTLIYALYGMNIEHRAKSQMRQFILQRTIRPGSFPVHRGDMEVKLVDKKIERLPAFREFLKEGLKKDFDYSAYYDDFHPEINERIKECMAFRDQLIAEGGAGSTRKRRQSHRRESLDDSEDEIIITPKHSKKRRVVSELSEDEASTPRHRSRKRRVIYEVYEDDDDDDDDDVEEIPRSIQELRPSRDGLRQKQRVNYAEPQDSVVEITNTNVQQNTAEATVASHHLKSQLDMRKESCSALFPANNDDKWANLDLVPLQGDEATLTQAQIDALINAAYRRKSSTLSVGPRVSAVKSPYVTRSGAALRRASFNAQPVTQSKEFRLDDPPSCVAGERDGTREQSRRSMRSTNKASEKSGLRSEVGK